MIMVQPKILNCHHLLLSAVFLYFLCPRFCRGQGNNTSTPNPCETSGRCGPFGVCSPQSSPICTCLQGFRPENKPEWDSGNWSSGCGRRVPLNCGRNNGTTNGGKQDGFLRIQMMQIPVYSDRWLGPENQCEDRCLRNCSCLAYGYDVNVGCVFWSGSLIDIQSFSSGSGSILYVRVSGSELEPKKDSKKIIIIVVVVGFLIISISACASWKWIVKRRRGNNLLYNGFLIELIPLVELLVSSFALELGKKKAIKLGKVGSSGRDTSREDALSQVNLEELPLFRFEIIENATNSFSNANKLGKGGFGTVYKGQLVDGREIAVKRLSQASTQGVKEFMNEMVLISKLQHRNLVRLFGFCVENNETILMYEYMPNKSLDFFLFDPSQDILDWTKRFNIIEGICRGLLYLHRDSRLKIIHRDLKPSNVLLDKDWNPKISDFGMARLFETQEDHISTIRVVGTYGYMAPEYAMKGRFSEKSDVFSFGVLVLEIVTGRRNRSFFHDDGSLNLLGHIWKLWNEDKVATVIDPRISNPSCQGEVMRCIHIGLLCVQQLANDRPTIPAVLSMLSSEIIELPEPKQPAFTLESSHSDAGTSSSQHVSITVVDGR